MAKRLQQGQRDRAVRAPDLQFGGPEFKSRTDRQLDLFSVVPSSNRQLVCLRPVGFLTLLSLISIICFRHFSASLALVL